MVKCNGKEVRHKCESCGHQARRLVRDSDGLAVCPACKDLIEKREALRNWPAPKQ